MTESICFYFNLFLLSFSNLTPYCCTTVFPLRTIRTNVSSSNFFEFFLIFPPSFLRGFKIIIIIIIKEKKIIIIGVSRPHERDARQFLSDLGRRIFSSSELPFCFSAFQFYCFGLILFCYMTALCWTTARSSSPSSIFYF